MRKGVYSNQIYTRIIDFPWLTPFLTIDLRLWGRCGFTRSWGLSRRFLPLKVTSFRARAAPKYTMVAPFSSIRVKNDTGDLYRYFDATAFAELTDSEVQQLEAAVQEAIEAEYSKHPPGDHLSL